MIDAGEISEQEFADDMARLDDPDFLMPSAALWAVWGRRPGPEFTRIGCEFHEAEI